MEALLIRRYLTKKSTVGVFKFGLFSCYSLEDPERELPGVPVAQWKVQDDTAIPRGRYRVDITPSKRFKRDMPELMAVPGFTGIRIHSGNDAVDTRGCILLGRTRAVDYVGESRMAFDEFFRQLKQVKQREEVFLTIKTEAA